MASTINCPNCNKENRPGSKFCLGCGQPLPGAAPAPAQPPPARVPSSVYPAAPPSVQPQTSKATARTQAGTTQPQQPPAGVNFAWIAIGGGLALLAILVGIVALWFWFKPQLPALVTDIVSTPTAAATGEAAGQTPTLLPASTPMVETPPPATEIPAVEPTEGAPLAPTSTPLPPTDMPTSPLPPPTGTPTGPQVLFRDDFETGIRPEWDTQNANTAVVNGQLVAEGILQTRLGDESWTDYRVSFELGDKTRLTDLTLQVRVQDENNFLKMLCVPAEGGGTPAQLNCTWFRLVGGQEVKIPGAELVMPEVGPVTLEITGNTYQVIDRELTFLDDTVSFGGISFSAEGTPINLDYFEVTGLPPTSE